MPPSPDHAKLTAAEIRERRDAEILRMWEDDATTLDAIGQEFGLTRERVRQLLREMGASPSMNVRHARAAKKAESNRNAVVDFQAQIMELLQTLQAQDETIMGVRLKLTTAYPDVDPQIVYAAIRRSKLVFRKTPATHHFSEEGVRAGVWYALAVKYGGEATKTQAAALLPASLVDELSGTLSAQGLTPQDIELMLRSVARGSMLIADPNPVSLSHAHYEQIRGDFLSSHNIPTAKGQLLWPPTRQTIMKRFGGNSWAAAVEEIGLEQSARKGRGKGQLYFSAADYSSAIRDYLAYCEAYKLSPTYVRYEAWTAQEQASQRKRPSAPSIRNVFRTWTKALQSKGDPEHVGMLSPDA
jgi:hypothetical protein